MAIPLQISFSDMAVSDAVKARIEELAVKLDRFQDSITSCHVVVSLSGRHHRKGRLYDVSIDLKMHGHEIAVNRNPIEDHAHEDIYVAVHEAFDTLLRKLASFSQHQRGDVKAHEAEPSAVVVRLFPDENYGFIEDAEVGEIYFHANSVADQGFAQLAVGSKVHYRAEPGDKGLQATIVKPVKGARRSGTTLSLW
ncbi:MAG TPA: HPF/RaiA family ribosome-associated protein [Dongiaceae bacterium]|nr:HPF/RaiA family ribosome-associated protein [Dongiaceae bacterium]